MALPDLRVHSAGNRTPAPHDTDPYDGVEVAVVLQHLRGNPIASARLTDRDALRLAADLIAAVAARPV